MKRVIRKPYPQSQLDREFNRFVERNPHVVTLFISFALRAQQRGQKIGAKAVWERLRWDLVVETDEVAPRLNNNYTSRMARLAMEREPRLDEFFETRELRT